MKKRQKRPPYLSRWNDELKAICDAAAVLGIIAAVIITVCLLAPAKAAAVVDIRTTELPNMVTEQAKSPPQNVPELPDVPLDPELLQAVADACEQYNVPIVAALAVMETESGYQTDAVNGPCVGLYQINTTYAAAYEEALGVTNIADPAQNIACGVWYLGELLQRTGELDHALMAYNMGNIADELWDNGTRSTNYTNKVHAAIERLEAKN